MRSIAIFSGGLDSTVMLEHLLRAGDEVFALSIDYGQRHRRELEYARATAERLQIEWRLADLRAITPLLAGSSLTSSDVAVPHGHYAEESMKATVVPNRNMIMLAIAAGWALSRKCDRVAYGAHAGDHAIYPDCRPAFVEAMRHALGLADWDTLELYTPFLTLSKADIVREGARLGVDFASTWSCYEGGEVHCGRCGTCVERREAFALAGIADPTTYSSVLPLPPAP
ncbi:7-cyano-7-deazaguanine synthase QueC [Anatilimnocola floriformis]|uniref:7-cyano-7-deazaguanine synthase QueC n=1 Tax=Anatilimnocola floriformis TaxID=2948575 RepID=UPI0020C593EE|nr:7-cyano-7-deazaguanine synthase QueC [Anatilimnocola floriformis]